MKTCTRCLAQKDESAFPVRRASPDGFAAMCKECKNAASRALYAEDPEERRRAKKRADKSWGRRMQYELGFATSWNNWVRAKRCGRVPAWVRHRDFVPLYAEAARQGLMLDHIVPLHGKYVSGLHVPSNLQLMDLKSNELKRSKFPCVVIVNPKKRAEILSAEAQRSTPY